MARLCASRVSTVKGACSVDDHSIHVLRRLTLLLAVLPVRGGEGELFRVVAEQVGIQGPVLLKVRTPRSSRSRSGGRPRTGPARRRGPRWILFTAGGSAHSPRSGPGCGGPAGRHQLLVDVPGLPDALLHRTLGNLIKGDPPGLLGSAPAASGARRWPLPPGPGRWQGRPSPHSWRTSSGSAMMSSLPLMGL